MTMIRNKPPAIRRKEAFSAAVRNPDAVQAEVCRRSFYAFIQYFWDIINSEEPVWNWHIKFIADLLQSEAERVGDRRPLEHDLIINISPGTTKSSLCSIFFQAWCWTRWDWMRFICASYSGQLSLELAERCRNIVKSDKFKRLYPHLTIVQDKAAKSNYQIYNKVTERKGGGRYSTSVTGTVTGFHGDIIVLDDPLDPNRSISPIELEKANNFMDQTLSTRKTDKSVTPTILVQQRLHQNDCSGHRLEQNTPVKHISLPADLDEHYETLTPKELKKYYVDNLMDPVRLNRQVLAKSRALLGQYAYAGQFGQNPIPPGGGMFKVDNIPLVLTPPPDSIIVSKVRYWDKAGTYGQGAFTVGVLMAKTRHGSFVVLDVKRGQWEAEQRERIIRATALADGNDVAIGHEQEGGSGGKDSARATTKMLAGFYVFSEKPTGDKVWRADPFSVQVNEGNVSILKGDWNKDYIEELRYFPLSKYADQVDASAAAFNFLTKEVEAGPYL